MNEHLYTWKFDSETGQEVVSCSCGWWKACSGEKAPRAFAGHKGIALRAERKLRAIMKPLTVVLLLAAGFSGCATANYDSRRYFVPCTIPIKSLRVASDRNVDNACSSTARADVGMEAAQFQEGSYGAGCFHADKDAADVTVATTDVWEVLRHEVTHLMDLYCLKPGQKPTEGTHGAGDYSPKVSEDDDYKRRDIEGIKNWVKENTK
jgi:hypothetical protein